MLCCCVLLNKKSSIMYEFWVNYRVGIGKFLLKIFETV